MGFEIQRYLFDAQTVNTNADILYTETTTIGGDDVVGADFVIGSLEPLDAWAYDTFCSCPDYPATATPPMPTVYPVLFSSDLVYGREHFSADMKMFRGDTFTRTLIVFQDGQYYDITNHTVRMTFKWDIDDADADAFLVLTEGDGIYINNPTQGEFYFTIQPNDTESLPPKRVELFYDAQITDTVGNVYTVAYGKLVILPDVSITS